MAPTAAYDEIADWYETEFLAKTPADGHPLGLIRLLRDLLGEGSGTCLEIGCGTGVHRASTCRLRRPATSPKRCCRTGGAGC